jgi:hypothetical protein
MIVPVALRHDLRCSGAGGTRVVAGPPLEALPPCASACPMIRFGLRAVLDASPEVEVVGDAVDGAELLAVVARCAPDVVRTDLGRT